MNWHKLLELARAQDGFSDRKKRTCHEVRNAQIVFTENFTEPLQHVRKLGWHYPSNEELESVFMHADDYHRYTYTQHVSSQLQTVIDTLNNHENTRRAILYLTDAHDDDQNSHQPCLLSIWFAIRERKLHLTVFARSIDLLLGLPANLYQSSVLAQRISKDVSAPVGTITFCMGSAHVFSDYDEQLHTLITSLKK